MGGGLQIWSASTAEKTAASKGEIKRYGQTTSAKIAEISGLPADEGSVGGKKRGESGIRKNAGEAGGSKTAPKGGESRGTQG